MTGKKNDSPSQEVRPETQGPERRQPDEKPEKQYVEKDKARNREYQEEQADRGTATRDPGHPYEHGGARRSDRGG